MAICTKKVKVTIDGVPVVGVTDIPALGAAPEKIDVTTLAHESRQYINGIKDYGDLEFSCIYEESIPKDAEDLYGSATPLLYKDLRAMEDGSIHEIKVVVPKTGTAGDDLEIYFNGSIAVALAEFAVNAAVTFTLSVALASEIKTNKDPKKED